MSDMVSASAGSGRSSPRRKSGRPAAGRARGHRRRSPSPASCRARRCGRSRRLRDAPPSDGPWISARDPPHRGKIHRAIAPAGGKRAAKAQIVGRQHEEARHVRRLQRAGQTRHQAEPPRLSTKAARRATDRCAIRPPARRRAFAGSRPAHLAARRAAPLPDRVDHRAGETGLRQQRQKIEIRIAIGEEDGDEPDGLRQRPKRGDHRLARLPARRETARS